MSFSEWKEVKLKECASFREGYVNPSQKVPEYFGDEIKWIRANDLNNTYVYNTTRKLSRKGFESAGKSALLFKPDTIVISKSGTIGRLGILKDYMCGNRATINIEANSNLCSYKFLFYWLLQNQKMIEEMAVGSVQKNLYISVLSDLTMSLPSILEQQSITATLSAIDDTIELNNQINKTLEETAQAIFKSWFVDFEPFQNDQFEESDLGLIPKGWRVGTLGEIAEITSGKRPISKQEEETSDYSVPLVGASCIMRYVNEALYNEPILVIGRVGTHGVVQRFNKQCWPSDNTLVLKSNYYEFVYQTLRRIDYKTLNRGSTQPLITQTDIKKYKIIIPDNIYLSQFEDTLKRLFDQYTANNSESKHLAIIRDTLLPKLMSCEIRVSVEEVV